MKHFTGLLIILLLSTAITTNIISQTNDKSVFQNPCEVYNSSIIMNDKIRIINLGPNLNSPADDYAPTLTMDGNFMLFCSNRNGSVEKSSGVPSHDFWAASKSHRLDTVFGKVKNLSDYNLGVINTPANEGAASISADGRIIYFTGCGWPDGYGDCDIYASIFTNGKWVDPYHQGENINTEYFDSQPSIGPYSRRIYFASNRTKKVGIIYKNDDMDIWYCDWDTTLKKWGPAVNLEEINTSSRECAPFIAADGVTLFFSSNGHSSNYGGLDIYVTRYDISTKKWSPPKNIGNSINSSKDEMFINIPIAGDVLYFSSNRKDIPGHQGNFDLYMCYLPNYKTDDECVPSEGSSSNIMYDSKSGDFLIEYSLSVNCHVEISVFDVYGNKLADLDNADFEPGTYFNQWKTVVNNAQIYKSGMYLFDIKITSDNKTYHETKKMLLLNPIKQLINLN